MTLLEAVAEAKRRNAESDTRHGEWRVTVDAEIMAGILLGLDTRPPWTVGWFERRPRVGRPPSRSGLL